jgi:hypothetical protein
VDTGLRKINLLGARLVTVAADSVAKVRADDSNGEVLYSLAALAKTADDTSIPTVCESGKLYVSLSGSASEVFVYLE